MSYLQAKLITAKRSSNYRKVVPKFRFFKN